MPNFSPLTFTFHPYSQLTYLPSFIFFYFLSISFILSLTHPLYPLFPTHNTLFPKNPNPWFSFHSISHSLLSALSTYKKKAFFVHHCYFFDPNSSSLFLLLKSWLPLSIWCSFWQWLFIQVIIGVFARNGLAILFWGYWYNLCHDDNRPTINHYSLIHGNHPSFLHVLWNW